MDRTLFLADEAATDRLGHAVATHVRRGDTILLNGPIGSGKTHFARAMIQSLLSLDGRHEDVPSPTFTLVQTYETTGFEVWHADLYRLTDPVEAVELGLVEAMETSVVLIEWPERLGPDQPQNALNMNFSHEGAARSVTLSATDTRWTGVISDV